MTSLTLSEGQRIRTIIIIRVIKAISLNTKIINHTNTALGIQIGTNINIIKTATRTTRGTATTIRRKATIEITKKTTVIVMISILNIVIVSVLVILLTTLMDGFMAVYSTDY